MAGLRNPNIFDGLRYRLQRNSVRKVFCIGLNKTGTTSIGDALKLLGYRRFGWVPKKSVPMTDYAHRGEIGRLLPVLLAYDAFEDFPWPLIFRELDSLFPQAKFILTTRQDEHTWLASIQRHIARGGYWVGHEYAYGSADPALDGELYLRRYREHIAQVRSHFASRPGKLLEVCFENGDGWEKLCAFLGVEMPPRLPFPHANTAEVMDEKLAKRRAGAAPSANRP